MQKVSIKKLSLLGLVLASASAVTAALIPTKEVKFADSGRCIDDDPGSGIQWTCTLAGTGALNCDLTAAGNAATRNVATDAPTLSTTLNFDASFCSNGLED